MLLIDENVLFLLENRVNRVGLAAEFAEQVVNSVQQLRLPVLVVVERWVLRDFFLRFLLLVF